MKNALTFLAVSALLSVAGAQNAQGQQTATLEDTLHEAVVTGTRSGSTDIRYLPLTVTSVGRREIENRYSPSLMPTLAEQVPGLFVTDRGVLGYGISTSATGAIKIRGIGSAPTTDVMVLIDGHPQYMGLMGHTLADAYQSLLAQKVEIIRGPASMLYGSNAMGGVINILTRKALADGIKNNIRLGAGSYGTITTEYTGLAKYGKWNGVLGGAYNRTDGHRKNMNFDQATAFGKIGYKISDNWNAEANIDITHFNSSNPGITSSPIIDNDMNITRGMTSASLADNYRNARGAATYFFSWGHHNINDGYNVGATPKDYRYLSNDNMHGLNLYQTISFFEGNNTTFGFDYQHVYGKAWDKYSNGNSPVLANKQADELAGYIDFRQTLLSILTLDGGLRYDHHSRAGNQWIPQGGVSVRLPADAEIKATVSKGFRVPTLKDLYLFPPKNPDLKPEKLMNYEISYTQNLMNGRLNYGANLFYYDANNLIETAMVSGKPMNQNTGKLHTFGVEANATYRVNAQLSLSTNYSYLHANKLVTSAPRNKFYLGGDYSLNRWHFGGGLQHIGGLYKATSGKDKSETYTLLNLRAAFKATKFLSLYVKGENLLAQKYEINAGFPMPRATFMGGVDLKF